MIIHLVSVQHSGSRSLARALRPRVDTECGQRDDATVGTTMLCRHMYGESPLTDLDDGPIVSPVVDPLKCMISNIARGERTGIQIVSDWVLLSALPATFIRYGEPGTEAAIKAFGDANNLYGDYVDYASIGAGPESALKTAYNAGDIVYLESAIGGELAVLRGSSLRGWLEELGYTDLIWWG